MSTSSPTRTKTESLARFTAWALPFAVALSRTSPSAQWRGDLGLLRDVGLCSVGLGGGVSTALVQAATLVPLGSLAFRASLVSALALGALGGALYHLARLTLAKLDVDEGTSSHLGPFLAALASVACTMTPHLQREATIAGSSALGVALAAWAVTLVARVVAGAREPRDLALAGALAGAALGEAPVAGFAATVTLVALVAGARAAGRSAPRVLIPPRILGAASGLGLLAAGLALAPPYLRWLAPGASLDLGAPGFVPALAHPELLSRPGLLEAWTDELGLVPAALAALGGVPLLARGRARPLGIAVATMAGLDAGTRELFGAVDLLAATRSLGLAALGIASVAGAFYALRRLATMQVPLARAAAVLLVAFDATVVALVVEQAGETADRANQRGAAEWTDVALSRLEPGAAVIVRSAAPTWRLLAAQLVEGKRPDVLVVPLALLEQGRTAERALGAERRLEPLLRSLALTRTSDGFALGELARTRILHVELDRSWDARTTSHLTLDGPWLEFSPQPLGKTDRKPAVAETLAPMRRLLGIATAPGADPHSAHVVSSTVRSQASVLLRLGESSAAIRYLAEVEVPGTNVVASGGSLDVLFASAASRVSMLRKGTTPARARETPRAGRPR